MPPFSSKERGKTQGCFCAKHIRHKHIVDRMIDCLERRGDEGVEEEEVAGVEEKHGRWWGCVVRCNFEESWGGGCIGCWSVGSWNGVVCC